jgi:uncharacterized protein (DUF779 family)
MWYQALRNMVICSVETVLSKDKLKRKCYSSTCYCSFNVVHGAQPLNMPPGQVDQEARDTKVSQITSLPTFSKCQQNFYRRALLEEDLDPQKLDRSPLLPIVLGLLPIQQVTFFFKEPCLALITLLDSLFAYFVFFPDSGCCDHGSQRQTSKKKVPRKTRKRATRSTRSVFLFLYCFFCYME